ncbi:hypothetical protein I6H88_12270 [Elizabethkingia bruuniana]|uniref:Uncharacterized protein n=1 Tax=Elizabethkingia bruuniana TaxID=1756149 RepID=A0A7T7UVY5_9FLAO|nr:hypothetical protein [Elizabethkingia bruuniana]KGO10102.1 hypothetical protein KS04_11110 [Elizabethkingia miricola]AQX83820.1 hypothetical protein AYC65_01740 [Elizabethkingia bruuniana]KUY22068.1 hypothetical protein ATB97_12455 [Elizabethkingia bruuniana]OPB62280.1 hypothetical protein BAY12_10195 [Elizabethkingia bruuniana]QQN57230.1 hypothetical protein I6H88_12270 [Elizabethkingia bruuniana]
MKTLQTNWINILGVFVVLFLYTFLNSWINYPATFIQALFGAFVLVCLYGIMFWVGFIIMLIILDSALIIPNPKNLKIKLLIEWIVISSPFVYWAIKYPEQRTLYVIAIITFLITQLLRDKLINKDPR